MSFFGPCTEQAKHEDWPTHPPGDPVGRNEKQPKKARPSSLTGVQWTMIKNQFERSISVNLKSLRA